jgi:hypothetical protein
MKLAAIFFLSLSILASCSNPIDSGSKCPCKVKIPQLQEDGTYRMEVVELKTLQNPKKISSSIIQVSEDPRFYNNGSIQDSKPQAHYIINSEGVIIPTRTETSEMFSIYKTMEDLYFFDQAIGTDKILTYPRRVSLETRSGKTRNYFNNAYFAVGFDRLVILKYIGDKVPLSINPGVLAHEHFHSIFFKIINPVVNTTNDMRFSSLQEEAPVVKTNDSPTDQNVKVSKEAGYNYLILKSLDEGLADFWANIHTNLENPYNASYSEEEHMDLRVIRPYVAQMDRQEDLKNLFNFELFTQESPMASAKSRPIHGSIYGKGIMYSNLIKSVSENMFTVGKEIAPEEKKILIGQWMIASLQKLSKIVEAKGKTAIITQADILSSFIPEVEERETLARVCADFKLFLSFHSDKVTACSGL